MSLNLPTTTWPTLICAGESAIRSGTISWMHSERNGPQSSKRTEPHALRMSFAGNHPQCSACGCAVSSTRLIDRSVSIACRRGTSST